MQESCGKNKDALPYLLETTSETLQEREIRDRTTLPRVCNNFHV